MKNKILKTLCVLTAAAICVAASGCGNKDDGANPLIGATAMNLDDYACPYTANIDGGKVERANKINALDNAKIVSYDGGIIIYRDSSSQYGIYNAKRDKVIASGLGNMPSRYTSNDVALYFADKNLGAEQVTDCYAEDGTKILTDCKGFYGTAISYKKIKESAEPQEIFEITADILYGSETTKSTLYYTVERDEKTDKITGLSRVHESSIEKDGAYVAGDDYNDSFRRKIYGSGKEIKGVIAEYTFEQLGNTYLFYDETGASKGSVKITNGAVLGFVSSYMYYYTVAPVFPEASSGFNYIEENGDKYMYTLNRYDIINNVNVSQAFSAVITGFTPLYNNTKKAYDGVIINGYGASDGIAYKNYNRICHITDAELKSVYDLDIFGGDSTIYGLSKTEDEKKWYYIGGYVVNEKMKVSSHATYSRIYPEQQLLAFSSGDYMGFADYTGKIVIEPKYTRADVKFYGDTAYVTRRDGDGNVHKILIDKNGLENDLSLLESATVAGTVSVTVYGGFYELKTAFAHGDSICDYYSFAGNKILTLNSRAASSGDSSVSCFDCGGTYIICETSGGETNYYRVS